MGGCMSRERKMYTMSSDPYCSVIKQYFNEKGIDYSEVDVGINEAGFNELIRFYGKGPLPVIVEDGRIVPITQVMQNAHVMF
jgi:glutaredoxin